MFKPRFAPLVASGAKRQTIRERANCLPGDIASLRQWAGAPYRSRHLLIGESRVESVLPILIDYGCLTDADGDPLTGNDEQAFARADGFANAMEMVAFFRDEHTLPFRGDVITWGDLMPF